MKSEHSPPDLSSQQVNVAADVGGTFTDVVMTDGHGRTWRHKLPSTPPNYEQAVLDAIKHLLDRAECDGSVVSRVAHGTTVATNAILEHQGARTALITTRGFRDVLELRRIRIPKIYDLFLVKPPSLIPRSRCLELTERIAADGQVITPLDEDELVEIKRHLEKDHVESVAVCFLHSYAYPQHEKTVGEYLRRELPDMMVCLSCEVVPERKEYERTATTVVNAYVQPVMKRYLESMRKGLESLGVTCPLMIMQSSGGLTPSDDAAARPAFVLESGPAAGVLGSLALSRSDKMPNLITFDMGGTTAKASLIENGQVSYSTNYEVGASMSIGNRLIGGAGELILAPSIDIAEVGAGGGSIAYLDEAGGLHVGPRSAGAMPGPACYQRGGEQPTVTDANVVLGYIRSGVLADGKVTVDFDAAYQAIDRRIATSLDMTVLQAALGIHQIANARMMRALREVSSQRGRDPRNFAMIAFGGSGPIHAAGLARELGIKHVMVPPMPGLFSAVGLLNCNVEHHDVCSCLIPEDRITPESLNRFVEHMQSHMRQQFLSESYTDSQTHYFVSVDVQLKGQSSTLRIALPDGPIVTETIRVIREKYHCEYEQQFGHRPHESNSIEVVAVRLIGRAENKNPNKTLPDVASNRNGDLKRTATFADPWNGRETPIVTRAQLRDRTTGPLLIDEYDTTIVIPPDATAWYDAPGNIHMEFNVD